MEEKSKAKHNGVYGAHRERQRRRILEAAGKLFDERGIDRVTVAEIVGGAGIRASTLYEYFPNKDEIVWAMVREVMVESSGAVRKALEETPGNALAKITAWLKCMEDELAEHPERVRFMAQFDALYARDWTVARLLEVEKEISLDGFDPLGTLIREGRTDGSLRQDLDPELTMHAVLNGLLGAQRRLASLGSRVEEEYGRPVERLFRETVRVVLMGLRA